MPSNASDATFAGIEALLARLDLPTAGLHDQFPRAYVVAIDLGAVIGCAGLETYGTAGLLRSVAVFPPMRRAALVARWLRTAWWRRGARGLKPCIF